MSLRSAMTIGIALVAGIAAAEDAPTLTTQNEKRSYAIGANIGAMLRDDLPDLDKALLIRGFQDAYAGAKTVLSAEEVQTTMDQVQREMQEKRLAAMQKAAAENKAAGEAFLEQNKTKEGVITLPSGAQYKVLKPGDGAKPTAEDTVVFHYRGTLLDGTEFDSSYSRNQPLTAPVGRLIKGWVEALQLMPVGSKWQLFLPPNLAYGERGTPGPIGPNATLIFEIELLSIKEKGAAAAPAPSISVQPAAAPVPAPKPAAAPKAGATPKAAPPAKPAR